MQHEQIIANSICQELHQYCSAARMYGLAPRRPVQLSIDDIKPVTAMSIDCSDAGVYKAFMLHVLQMRFQNC